MNKSTVGPQEVKSLSLYDRETDWKQLEELLADGLESAEDSEALVALVEKNFLAVVLKRDSFCAFLAFLEDQAAFAAIEIQRLTLRKKRIEAAGERLEKLAIDTIRSLGPDEKGKWKRLEGQTSTLSLAKNTASVEITDDKAVPVEFKTLTFTCEVPAGEKALKFIAAIVSLDQKLKSDPVVSIRLKEVAAALKEMLPCTDCGELGVVRDEDPNRPVEVEKCMHCEGKGCCQCKETGIEGTRVNLKICPACNGDKQVPRQVPGARLVTDKVRLVRK